MGEVLAQADPVRVALATAMVGALYVIQAGRWRQIALSEGKTSHRTCIALVLSAVAVNNVVPGRPGEALRGFWLGRVLRIPVSRAFGTVLVDRVSDDLVLLVALLASVPFVEHPQWLRNILLVGVVLGIVLSVGMVVAWWYASRSRIGRARAHDAAVERSRLRRQLSGLVRSVARIMSGRSLVLIIGMSAASWLCAAAAAWLVAAALGLHISIIEATFVTAVLNLGSVIPSSPGFIGTHQWLSIAALGLFAVDRSDAFAFSVVMQAIGIVPTTLVGGAVMAVIISRDPFRWRPETSTNEPEASPALPSPQGPL